MTDSDPLRLELTGEGVTAWRGDEQLLSATEALADPQAQFWTRLSALCDGQPDIDVLLSPPYMFDIRLADDTATRDVVDILAMQSPILPSALIWTGAHAGPDGHIVIHVAKREWATIMLALFAQKNLPTAIFRSASTQGAFDQHMPLPKRLPRRLFFWAMAILIAAFSGLSISAWQERRDIEAAIASLTSSGTPSTLATQRTPSIGRTNLSDILARLPPTYGDDARLAAIARQQDGGVEIEIDTEDPDRLREIVRADPKLAGLRETKQAQRPDGRYHVIYMMRAAP